jgi:hypothetical protein
MLILDSLLVGGLRFVLDKIVRATEAEAQDDADRSRERLLEAQSRLARGEISEDELVAAERDFVAALGRIRDAGRGPISMPSGHGADIEYFDAE